MFKQTLHSNQTSSISENSRRRFIFVPNLDTTLQVVKIIKGGDSREDLANIHKIVLENQASDEKAIGEYMQR